MRFINNMESRNVVFVLLIGFLSISINDVYSQSDDRPNVLVITVDDMNWNSVGAFGNEIEDITPNIDKLSDSGVRFNRAYVTAANCAPSRVSIQTGLYPQQSGARGFYYINDDEIPSISTELKKSGYFTGVINKSTDTNPSPINEKYWDFRSGFNKVDKYSAKLYGEKSQTFFDKARKNVKPFYLVVNIADPHKPNFNDPTAANKGADTYEPSRVINESEIAVPGFLPEIPDIRKDVRNYYNSVKRADDCVGAITESLESSGLAKNTLIIFLSDHGMPFPFAKSTVYDNGLRTPLIMVMDGKIEESSVSEKLVSAVDLFPTIMGAVGLNMPESCAYLGASLLGESEVDRSYVFGSFDENAQGYPSPMRGVISKNWNYVFNAWSDGETEMKSATMYHLSFKTMIKASKQNDKVRERVEHYKFRQVEELYNLLDDPNCLKNLADDPAHAEVLEELRSAMRDQMVSTNDYLLAAFDVKDDPEALMEFMKRQHEEAAVRAENLKWKRPTNISGPSKQNTLLFQPEY